MKKFILSLFVSLFVAGLFVLPVFVFAAKGGWFLSRFAQNPEAAVSSFLRGVKQGDTDGALKGIISFRRDYFLKILGSFKKDNIAFDIDYSVDAVSFEGNAARIAVKIPIRDAKGEAREIMAGILKGGARSWSSYLELVKDGGTFVVAPSLVARNPEQWDFFLVKSGSWLRGYRWEIIDAPEFIGLAQDMSVANEIARMSSQIGGASWNTANSQRDARRISDIKQVQLALELYYDKYKQYPPTILDLQTRGFLLQYPKDPSTGEFYFYATPQDRNRATYHLGAKLEDLGNPALRTDPDFSSKAQNYRNGFDGSDPIYDITP